MLVETYEATETDELGFAEDRDEAEALCKQLGLEGQKRFFRSKEEGRENSCPYRKMTREEMTVYRVLCPQKTSIENYSDGPIPVRVLQVATHAKEFFGKIEVWHPENADIKDPVLVGENRLDNGDQEKFILARWGEVLLSFGELRALAGKIYRETIIGKLETAIAEAQADLNRIQAMSETTCLQNWRSSNPSYNWYSW